MTATTEHLTEDDINSLCYFHKEKGDMTRWPKWDAKRPLIQRQFPEVLAAMEQLKIAERTLDAVVNNMEAEACA